MKKIERHEVVDYQTYEETREDFRSRVLGEKARRRIHVGDCFTFLFENALTMRYQVQEMMRAERIVKERDILQEIETYNTLLGGEGELGCTLLIEIDDPGMRDRKLREWRRLPESLYVRMEDGRVVRAQFDEGQRSAERISSVQYLKFPIEGQAPVSVGVDFPGLEAETRLSPDQRAALSEDLR